MGLRDRSWKIWKISLLYVTCLYKVSVLLSVSGILAQYLLGIGSILTFAVLHTGSNHNLHLQPCCKEKKGQGQVERTLPKTYWREGPIKAASHR